MRVLWHSVAPWEPTGYGTQTAIWVPRLASLGHEVAISAYHGLQGAPIEWRGHKVYPSGAHPRGADVMARHAADFRADLVISLVDVWALEDFEPPFGCGLACWAPVETSPLSRGDRQVLQTSGAIPIAISEFGREQLNEAGFECLYVPHGIDTDAFRPDGDRPSDVFTIMINAAGVGGRRKAWPEQLTAFARLYKRHPDARLYLHTEMQRSGIRRWVEQLKIADAVTAPNRYRYSSGQIGRHELAETYRQADLLSACSRAEGFGLPIVEAQACGIPAVATKFSSMPQVCAGWLVNGDLVDVPGHDANWMSPDIASIEAVYEEAYQRGPVYQAFRASARDHALQFDADRVLKEHWVPALAEIGTRL